MKAPEFLEPFQMVIDAQLQSVSGFIEDVLKNARGIKTAPASARSGPNPTMAVRRYRDVHRRRESIENALIWAFDRKYHSGPASLEWRVHALCCQGYTEREVAAILNISKGAVWRAKKTLGKWMLEELE